MISDRCDFLVYAASAGAFDAKWAAEDSKQSEVTLNEVNGKMRASSQMLQSSFSSLASKLDQVTMAAEAAV